MGADITYLPVDENGNIDVAILRESIRVDTLAIVIMWANNETGVVHDMNSIAEICKEKNVFLVVDGTQAVGKIGVSSQMTKIDCMAFSAHKMYGPKGVGALYVNKSKRIKLTPLLHGGGHEKGYRSGTLNVPGIVGFGKAAQLSLESLESEKIRLSALQSYLESKLMTIENSQINGQKALRLPNTTNICLRFAENEQLLATFHQNIAVSTGSACSSEDALPSHVLTAMHLTEPQAKSCLRISYGKYTTQEEIDFTVDAIIAGVQKVRTASPKWQMFKQGYDMTEY
jgi:cysteine desulfurase